MELTGPEPRMGSTRPTGSTEPESGMGSTRPTGPEPGMGPK